MERLTKRSNETSHENEVCCTHFNGLECAERSGYCSDNCPWEEAAWSRLADYEDTGLTPEVCAEYKKFEDEAISKGVTFNRIVELMNADAAGRLVVLPCKVGDTVYRKLTLTYQKETVTVIGLDDEGIYIGTTCGTYQKQHFNKTLFFTREEAEAALKGGADNA